MFVVHRPGARSAASIILRGANDFMVDEMERSVHDALCVVKRVLESNLVVPGGGAVETALSIFLENFATSIVSFCCLCVYVSSPITTHFHKLVGVIWDIVSATPLVSATIVTSLLLIAFHRHLGSN